MPENKQRGFIVIILVILVLAVIIGIVGWRVYKNHQKTINTVGIPLSSVPEQFRDRAKSTGYYCPSWAAKLGVVTPQYCTQVSR